MYTAFMDIKDDNRSTRVLNVMRDSEPEDRGTGGEAFQGSMGVEFEPVFGGTYGVAMESL